MGACRGRTAFGWPRPRRFTRLRARCASSASRSCSCRRKSRRTRRSGCSANAMRLGVRRPTSSGCVFGRVGAAAGVFSSFHRAATPPPHARGRVRRPATLLRRGGPPASRRCPHALLPPPPLPPFVRRRTWSTLVRCSGSRTGPTFSRSVRLERDLAGRRAAEGRGRVWGLRFGNERSPALALSLLTRPLPFPSI